MIQWTKIIPVAEADEWEDKLFSLGLTNVVISNENSIDLSNQPTEAKIEAYFETDEDAARFEAEFGGESKPHEEQNWAAMSRERIAGRFLEIHDRFIVTLDDSPEFLEELRKRFPERELLEFPPDLAFGTGDHETTFSCLELIVELSREGELGENWDLLDLGTGTGILSIAAAKLGAGKITATDFDAKAVSVAKNRFEHHGVSSNRIELLEEDVHLAPEREPFKLVAANMFSTVLIQAMPTIRKSVCEDGRVILSGILLEQLEAVVSAANNEGLTVVKEHCRGNWASILLQVDKR